MLKHKMITLKAIVFVTLLFTILSVLTVLFRPKWYGDALWEPVTQIHDGFFSLEMDSADVVFIGSSQVFRDINPLVMWHDFGISSYDLTSSAQRLWISKYYVQEAIKRQHPKIIAMEMGLAFDDTPNDEDRNRKALDYMRLSPGKVEAIMDTIERSPEESFISYIFPVLRYHSRWSGLDRNDFLYFTTDKNSFLRGFAPKYQVESVSPDAWRSNTSQSGGVLPEQCKGYLDDIVDICDAANVELILFRSPTTRQSIEEHDRITEYAEQCSVPFLDFNLLTEDIGLEEEDFSDVNHLNINGANKISSYFGNYLVSQYDLRDWSTDERWKEDYQSYLEYDAENRIENQFTG